MIGVGFQSGTAAARQDGAADRPAARTISGAPAPGALPAKLSPAQRAELIRKADAAKGEAAKGLGLGAKEKLVVKDVIKDADGTTHTRYERTYAGLPVLGGDLVVDRAKSG
ncbi:M4 family peptidase, partial [Streptomyces sp. NPDC020125]